MKCIHCDDKYTHCPLAINVCILTKLEWLDINIIASPLISSMVQKKWLLIFCCCLMSMSSIYTFHSAYCKAMGGDHTHKVSPPDHMQHKSVNVHVYRQSLCGLIHSNYNPVPHEHNASESIKDTLMTNSTEYPATIITSIAETRPVTVSLVVPFRNRYEHRSKLLSHMKAFMEPHNFTMFIYFIHQLNSEGFSRSRLFNVGFRAVPTSSDCVLIHDVDMLPDGAVNYTDCASPIQLCSEIDSFQNSFPYATSAGGVVSASHADWMKINGMSNRFVGWGGEDDELFFRLRDNNLLDPSTGVIRRPPKGYGKYSQVNDGDHTERKKSDTYNQMIQWIEQAGRREIDFSQDGISTNHDIFSVENLQNISDNLYTTMVHVRW